MSRATRIPLPAAWATRPHRLAAASAAGLAVAARGLLALGYLLVVLVWIISVGVLVHEMVSWWAEFAA